MDDRDQEEEKGLDDIDFPGKLGAARKPSFEGIIDEEEIDTADLDGGDVPISELEDEEDAEEEEGDSYDDDYEI